LEGRPRWKPFASGVFFLGTTVLAGTCGEIADAARELTGIVRVTGGILEQAAGIDPDFDSLVVEGRRAARFHFDDPARSPDFDFDAKEGCIELSVTSKDVACPLVRIGATAIAPNALPLSRLRLNARCAIYGAVSESGALCDPTWLRIRVVDQTELIVHGTPGSDASTRSPQIPGGSRDRMAKARASAAIRHRSELDGHRRSVKIVR